MKQYIVDAFTDRIFGGNPAAVCVLEQALPEELMQSIAIENCLSETAYAVKTEGGIYQLRWFTPGGEIDLCGHATLATAFVILNFYEPQRSDVAFLTQSGRLTVRRRDNRYELDFPAYGLEPVEVTQAMTDALGATPIAVYLGRDLLCILEDEATVRRLTPDMDKVKALPGLLLHVTASGAAADCVSRSFAPKLGIVEDPVCGSGHCHIVPYWLNQLNKEALVAMQASRRGGTLYCRMEHDRVILAGTAALFAESQLFLDGEMGDRT